MYKYDRNAAKDNLFKAREIMLKYEQGNLFRKIEKLLREIDKQSIEISKCLIYYISVKITLTKIMIGGRYDL